MSNDDPGHGAYVRKVLDDGRRYVEELLEKNGRLRAALAELQVEHAALREQLAASRAAAESMRELKQRVAEAEQESRSLREDLAEARAAIAAHVRDQERLRVTLEKVDADSRRQGAEFEQLQQQANNLANLYVAMYRLHGALDRRHLVEAVTEIVANLIGSEELAFFEVDRARGELALIGSNGIDAGSYRRRPLDQGAIGAAVRSGEPLVLDASHPRGPGEEELSAVIPLRLQEDVNGAIAIFKLLTQKTGIEHLDRELFDLLASNAGMALHCADLHARFTAGATVAAGEPGARGE
jgi:hypothetical protein